MILSDSVTGPMKSGLCDDAGDQERLPFLFFDQSAS
jgi:hypothetical protein